MIFLALIMQVLFASMLNEKQRVWAGAAGRRRELRYDLFKWEFAAGLADAAIGEELMNERCVYA